MKYAIIQSGGKQYKAEEGKELLVDKLDLLKDKEYIFPQVLFAHDNGQVFVGMPYLEDVKVVGNVIGEEKGEKLHVFKYKAKVHYRRKMGFRSQNTRILVEKIQTGKADKKPEKIITAPKIKKTK